jgi:hypothetical protein
LEKKTGARVSTSENYKELVEKELKALNRKNKAD